MAPLFDISIPSLSALGFITTATGTTGIIRVDGFGDTVGGAGGRDAGSGGVRDSSAIIADVISCWRSGYSTRQSTYILL